MDAARSDLDLERWAVNLVLLPPHRTTGPSENQFYLALARGPAQDWVAVRDFGLAPFACLQMGTSSHKILHPYSQMSLGSLNHTLAIPLFQADTQEIYISDFLRRIYPSIVLCF